MPKWLDKISSLWQRVFFWQKPEGDSKEFKPHAHHDHALVLSVTDQKRVPHIKQWLLLTRVFDQTERRIFFSALLVFCLTLIVAGGNLLRLQLAQVPASGGAVTEALIGTPKLINPLFAPLNDVDRDLSALIYSGLFRLDASYDPVPDLVEQYHWTDDQKTLEVSLRKNITFHDGEPLTADDVIFTFQAIKNPNWRSPLAGLFQNVTVVRVDEQTVQFQLKEPNPQFLQSLTVGILPEHIWSNIPDSGAQLADANIRPIGSGPYSVASFTRDANGSILNYTLKKFGGYYGIKPYINEWKFRFYADRDSAFTALKNNQIDLLAFVPWDDAETLSKEQYTISRLELPQMTIAFFNLKDDLLKEDSMREALSLAIDKKELLDLFGEQVTPASSPFPFIESTTTTSADLEKARGILDDLKWSTDEETGLRFKGGASSTSASSTKLTLNITVPDQSDILRIAEYLKRRWSLLGAEVNIEKQTLQSVVTDRKYQVLVWNILLTPTLDIRPFWHSSKATAGGFNFSNLEDRDVDKALDAIGSVSSTEALHAARLALIPLIEKTQPALFLSQPRYTYVVSNEIKGVKDQRIAHPANRFQQALHWYVKTTWSWK